jgi:hypothetical protein
MGEVARLREGSERTESELLLLPLRSRGYRRFVSRPSGSPLLYTRRVDWFRDVDTLELGWQKFEARVGEKAARLTCFKSRSTTTFPSLCSSIQQGN